MTHTTTDVFGRQSARPPPTLDHAALPTMDRGVGVRPLRAKLLQMAVLGALCLTAAPSMAQHQPSQQPAQAQAGAPAVAAATTTLDREAMVRSALSAAPPTLAGSVRVMGPDGTILREGSGEFTCLPAPPGFAGPMCLDAQFMAWLDAYVNRRAPNVTGIGLAYMLAGDSPDGGASNNNPFDTEPTAGNDWMVDGPHVMIILPQAQHLAAVPAEHHGGGPYVMWKGTPYAHIMMPVGERPRQREVVRR